MVGGNAPHVVVHRGQARDRLLGHVYPRENGGRLADAGQALGQEVRRQVVQVQVNVVFLGAAPAPFADFHGHGAAHLRKDKKRNKKNEQARDINIHEM